MIWIESVMTVKVKFYKEKMEFYMYMKGYSKTKQKQVDKQQ